MLPGLVADILLDFTGEDGTPLVAPELAFRMAERALPVVASDLAVPYRLEGDDVSPSMPGEHRELWLLRAKVLVCRYLRAQAANVMSFSSGDKSVSRGREAANWADLEKSLMDEYASRVRRLNPATDECLLSLDATPLIYRIGSRHPERG